MPVTLRCDERRCGFAQSMDDFMSWIVPQTNFTGKIFMIKAPFSNDVIALGSERDLKSVNADRPEFRNRKRL